MPEKRRAEIYRPRDWSHQEQLKHIMSASAAYPPGTKPPFDWFSFGIYAVLTLALVGIFAVLVGVGYLLS